MRKYSSSFFDNIVPKTAAAGDLSFKKVVTSPEFVLPMAVMGASGLASAAQSGIKSLMDARSNRKSFQEMLDMHPHLKGRPESKRRFDTLARFNPHVAKDPSLAGAFLDHVDASTHVMGGSDATSDQGLLTAIGQFIGLRNQQSSAMRSEQDMRRGPDVGKAIGAFGQHLQATHGKLKAEHGELAVAKERNEQLSNKLKEMAAKDAFQAVTGLAPGPQRIQAIQDAAMIYSHPEIAPIADILADRRKHETFRDALKNIEKPGVLGLIQVLGGHGDHVEDVRGAVQQHGEGSTGGFRHRGGQARAPR